MMFFKKRGVILSMRPLERVKRFCVSVFLAFKLPEEIQCSFLHGFFWSDFFDNKIAACIPLDMDYVIKAASGTYTRIF